MAVAEAHAGDSAAALDRLAPIAQALTSFRDLGVLSLLEAAREQGRDDLVRETVDWIHALAPAAAIPTLRAHADRFAAGLTADPVECDRLLARSSGRRSCSSTAGTSGSRRHG